MSNEFFQELFTNIGSGIENMIQKCWLADDILNAFTSWVTGLLADGIKGCLQSTVNTLNGTFNDSGQDTIKTFLSATPDSYTGSTDPDAEPIWNGIEVISNNAIVPIAMFILTVVLVYELIQYVISGNNFRDFDTSIFFKWTIKSVCGILLVSNVFYIATSIFSFGSNAVTTGLTTLFGTEFNSFDLTGNEWDSIRNALTTVDIGQLLVVLILAFLIVIVTFVLMGAIIIVLASRMIEIFMYLSVSPIPMATMMNNDWGQIGKNWLRNMLALAFQGFFIVIALTVFKSLLSNVIASLTQISTTGGDSGSIVLNFAIILGYVLALIFTVFRSSNISKSVFAAQ